MKQVCLYCQQVSRDNNLWCHKVACPVYSMPYLFDEGEWLGEIEILRLVTILPHTVVYEAQRGETDILVKVAHGGYEMRLKQEARFLAHLQETGAAYPALPQLLPAYSQAEVAQFPYGRTIIHDTVQFFTVFAYEKGITLREMLNQHPQPWQQHVGWVMLSLVDCFGFLHSREKLHLALSPSSVLVRFDRDNVPRLLLLDLGLLIDPAQPLTDMDGLPEQYTPPELLLNGRHAGEASDIFIVGLIFYELLAGRPAFPSPDETGQLMLTAVSRSFLQPLNRPDLKYIPEIVAQALRQSPQQRHESMRQLFTQIQSHFTAVPKEKRSFQIQWDIMAIIAGALLAIALLMLIAASLLPGS